MAPKYLKSGQDFDASCFDPAFGFTGSAKGRHDARNHPVDVDDDEYGDGSYVDQMRKGGRVKRAVGGPAMPAGATPAAPGPSPSPMSRATLSMPVGDAAKAAAGMVQAGRAMGARQAIGGLQQAVHQAAMRSQMPMPAAGAAPAAQAPAQVPAARVPGMRKGGKFIEGAVHHPGRMKRDAAREGVSTHQFMEEHRHDANPSMRAATNLGLRLTSGDLSPRKRKG